MKKLLLTVAVVVTALVCLAFSASAAKEGYYTYYVTDGKAVIDDVDTSIRGAVSIPSKLGGYSVTTIDGWAFSHCTRLTSITIPDSVTSIGDYAFYDCTSLTSITIPDSVTSIGDWAFYFCTSLTSITIPDSVTSIGEETFNCCTMLTSITIPDSVTSIGDWAFEGCASLKSITIPDSVTTIGYEAFSYCTSLTSITIPDSVTTIGDWAFSYCKSLTSITIPDSVTSISSYIFAYCESLTSITIPDSVTSIGYGAFRGCTSFSDVYYTGSREQWNAVTIGTGNSCLTNATFHYNNCGHKSIVDVAQQNATCENIGYTAGEYCNDCKKWISGHTQIAKLGHSYSSQYTVDKKATYTQEGSKSRHCTGSGCTAKTSVTSIPKLTLGTVQNLKSASKNSEITLTWSKLSGAKGYRVFVYNKGWKALKTTGELKYTVTGLTAGKGYKFAVRAYTKDGSTTIWAPKYPTISTATAPLPPRTVSQSKGTSTTATVKWSACTNATGYRVYKYNSSTKKWETAVKATTKLYASVSGLGANKKYYIAVKPYTKTDSGYVWGTSYTKVLVYTATSAPVISGYSAADTKITVKWRDVSGESGYQVWYCTSKNGTYKKYSNVKANSTSLTVKGLSSGKTYYFKVRTYKNTNNGYVYSDYSSVKSAKTAVTPDYSEVIKEYRNAIRGYYNDYYDCEYINPYWPSHLGDLYYAYYDINSDGLKELIISAEYDGKYENINLFTYDDHYDKPVPVFGQNVWFGERIGLYILKDGSVIVEGSDSAFESSCSIYRLPSGSSDLEFVDGYCFVYEYHNVYDYIYDDYHCKNSWRDHCHQVNEDYEFVDCLTSKEWDQLESYYEGIGKISITWKPVIEKRSLSSIVTNTKKKGANMAIAMMSGYCGDDAYDYDLHMHLWSKEGYIAEFPFIKDIPENRFFVEGGFSAETYLFVPVDCKEIRIYEYSDTWSGEKGKLVKVLTDGKPFIIKGGYEVEGPFIIEAKTNDGRKLIYEPFISTKDGSLRVGEVFYDLNSW